VSSDPSASVPIGRTILTHSGISITSAIKLTPDQYHERLAIPKPRSTGRLGPIPAWLHEKVPSDLGEWELSKLPVPGSRGHPVSAIVA
jgi:hypothetical protein